MPLPFRKSALWIVAVMLPAAALALARWYPNTEPSILLELTRRSPAEGRLYRAVSPDDAKVEDSSLARAQVYALSITDSRERDRIQSLIFLARGRAQESVEILSRLSEASPNDPELLNDLGVATIALERTSGVPSDRTPDISYFKALSCFEEAHRLAPGSPAPLYNMLQIYRLVGLTRLVAETTAEYERVERDRRWLTALEAPQPKDPSELLARLQKAVEAGDMAQAAQLFQNDVAAYRRAVTEAALNSGAAPAQALAARYIAERFQSAYKDETIAAMLAPLSGAGRAPTVESRVLESRRLVQAGRLAYRQNKLDESRWFYRQADVALAGADSPFDRMWIDLSLSDTEVRLGEEQAARKLLEALVIEARQRNFRWILGQALASLGSNQRLSGDFQTVQGVLTESLETLNKIGAPDDTARPLYYLAVWRNAVNDIDGSIELGLRSFRVTRPDDHLRLTQLYWLMARSLFRVKYQAYAIAFQKASADEAMATGNEGIVATTMSDVASMYLTSANYTEARNYIARAEKIGAKLDPRARESLNYNLNLLCARMQLGEGNPKEAAACLQHNLESIDRSLLRLNAYAVPTMQLLAQAQTALGHLAEARELYQKAADIVENDDEYLKSDSSRSFFDGDRRELYESAIAFEYDNGGEKAAWSYMQRYRSKLFLEFLGRVNPAVSRIHRETLQRERVQQLIPSDLQVIEYFTLNDRLLVWLISRDRVRGFSVPAGREPLERKITELVSRIRRREDVDRRLEELYGLVVAPVSAYLNPRQTLAIIPDQALHRLPIGALRPSASSKYLGEQYGILESPNLTTLLASGSTKLGRDYPVIFGSQAIDAVAAQDVVDFKRIYTTAHAISDAAATKDTFFEQMEMSSIFHYAGHSVDAPDPMRSAVLLDADGPGPNSVTALDISRRRMRPDSLVILASCDSSVGDARDGIGVRGLTSAFLIAGAGAVTGSLWPVDDVSTSRVMSAFHEEFAAKTSAAEALRLAQVSFIGQNPDKAHPYYWSGFVVNGNLSALR